MDLFDAATEQKQKTDGPLAARMRPRNLDEYIGQDHIVGKGRLLRRAIAADQLTSVIFYGPPGTGKTTLARVIANHTKSSFLTLNAVLTGVANIRDAIAQADQQKKLYDRKTILFVDEVHRWNKSQQDALLPWVENGTIILGGATTENPFFEVNKALVSRSRVFQLKPLTNEDLMKAAHAACTDAERGYGRWKVEFEDGALEHLVDTANGDARSLLNALELAVETTPEKWPPAEGADIFISKETAEESIQKKVVLYDRDGDYHYDIISAFIKSLRGRDPDAALYWMARMIAAGEDPHFIFRRMLISACEDTGMADPMALTVVESCAAAFDRIGLPEGQYMLTQAALYLSTAPKSNSSMAYFDALKAVREEDAEVPNHLRDNSRDAEGFGHGAGYMYPHAYKDHWIPQQYLPDGLDGKVFYNPTDQGYEKTIRDDVLSRREMQIAALLEDSNVANNPIGDWWEAEHLRNGDEKTGENLTFSPNGKTLEHFQKRSDEGRSASLLDLRDTLLNAVKPVRHSRNLILGADDGLFVWEVLRRSPEGLTAGLCATDRGQQILEQYARTLPEIDRPLFSTHMERFADCTFDYVFMRDTVTTPESIEDLMAQWGNRPEYSGHVTICLAQTIPVKGQRLSAALQKVYKTGSATKALEVFAAAEAQFYTAEQNAFCAWDTPDLAAAFEAAGYTVTTAEKAIEGRRLVTEADCTRWFDADRSPYGRFISSRLSSQDLADVKALAAQCASRRITLEWKTTTAFVVAARIH